MRGLAALLAVLACTDPALAGPRLQELSAVTLQSSLQGFGGLSGLLLRDTGDMIAISDRGSLVTVRIDRDGDRIARAEVTGVTPLLNLRGEPVSGLDTDAEGIAPDGAGGFFVSFEARHRIWHYPAPGARPEPTRANPEFARLQRNSGLEALAHGGDGTLYAIPERSGAIDRPFPVFRLSDRWDRRLSVPRRGDFLVTGADIGPDGRLYIVERDFSGFAFATRIRRFTVTEAALRDEETLLETGYGRFGNLESIDAWTDAAGALRLTLVADDNFSSFQFTTLVEFRVEE